MFLRHEPRKMAQLPLAFRRALPCQPRTGSIDRGEGRESAPPHAGAGGSGRAGDSLPCIASTAVPLEIGA